MPLTALPCYAWVGGLALESLMSVRLDLMFRRRGQILCRWTAYNLYCVFIAVDSRRFYQYYINNVDFLEIVFDVMEG